jgi:adenylosuccinate lyase
MKKVWSDENKFNKWLAVEVAVVEAWAKLGRVPEEALPKIRNAKPNPERINEILKVTHHDMTAFLGALNEEIGEEGRYLHLGLTSSDVMDTALALQIIEAGRILDKDIDELIDILQQKALEYKGTLMAGRTHGVHAEPITLGLKFALWQEEMKRNKERLNYALDNISVGKISGAVGTYATVPPEVEIIACDRLGLRPAPISNQIVQRDRHAQFMTTLAIIASSLEKFATEIRALQKTEVRELEEPFSTGQTGSSAMPHKRNPELCERISGLARLVRGYALTSMENITLWHERDISHSSTERVTFPDGCLVIDYTLTLFTSIMKGLRVYPDRMRKNLELTGGLIFSQRVMLALIDKGLSREKAYRLVQEKAMEVWEKGADFYQLLKGNEEVANLLSENELKDLFDYNYYLRYVNTIFKRLGLLG